MKFVIVVRNNTVLKPDTTLTMFLQGWRFTL